MEVFSVRVSINRGDSSDVGVELPDVLPFARDNSGGGQGKVERRLDSGTFFSDLGPDIG